MFTNESQHVFGPMKFERYPHVFFGYNFGLLPKQIQQN